MSALLKDAPPWRFHLTEFGEWTKTNCPDRLSRISESDALACGYVEFTHEGRREFKNRLAESAERFAELCGEGGNQ